jgi:hypothetical protein
MNEHVEHDVLVTFNTVFALSPGKSPYRTSDVLGLHFMYGNRVNQELATFSPLFTEC